MNKVSKRELDCLKVLDEYYHSDQNCLYFRAFTSTKLKIAQIRRAVRSLARKGYAAYVRGLFDDDGMVAGSGYCITEKGHNYLNPATEKVEDES